MPTPDPFDVDGTSPTATEDSGRDDSPESPRRTGITLLAAAIAALIVVPVCWIAIVALRVEPDRAMSIVVRSTTLEVLVNTVSLVVVVTTLSVLIGVPLAILTTLTDLPYSRFWLVALSVPLVIPSYTSAYAFISVWGPNGLVQSLVAPLGVDSLPEIYGFPGTVFVLTLYNYPFVYLTTVAGLRSFDTSYIDIARSLENDLVDVFRRIVIPMTRPAILAGALLAALETAGDFGVPAMLRFDVFTRQIYVEHNALAHDYAAMLSLHLVAITLVILALESRVRRHRAVHGSARGETRSYTIRLGRWKWPALAACALVVGFAIVLPVAFLLWWLVTGPEAYVGAFEFRPEYAINSVYVSVLAAVVAAVLALPVAYLAAHERSLPSAVIERATYVGFAVPGVVIGLSLVSFGSSYVPAIYQTIPLLVFAYVVLYLPLAVGAARTSFVYVNPRFVEAARALGCTPLAAFRRVTLPLVLPGIVAGAALVFLHAMKELPATLLLRPTGFESLATFIWMAERNAYYGYAAAPALVLVCVSAIAILGVFPNSYVEYWSLFRRDGDPDGDESTDEGIGVTTEAERGERDTDRRPSAADGGTRVGPTTGTDTDHRSLEDERAETDEDVVLELADVTKCYDNGPAVSELSLSVREGEVLTLLGPSGCGKTTTLRLIAGLERPDAGTVRLRGRPIASEETFVPAEGRDVGIVFQEFALFPHRTVAANVAFGLPPEERDADAAVVDELLELVGLGAYRNRYPNELSGGQKQRVALARSLAPEPDVLLLDEPLSDLDAGLRVRMRETVTDVLEAVDVTAVWVTHNQAEALSVGDRTAVVTDGSIEQIDSPRTLFMRPASRLVADFLGRATYLRGRLVDGTVDTPIGAVDVAHSSGGGGVGSGPVDVLVRPDDVAIEPAPADRADGRIVHRQFDGPTARYRIELSEGDVLESRRSHEEWFEIGTPVAVTIAASHPLPAFDPGDA
ncbi:ABC transporter [Natronococcus pandeyae]|uniref:Molybdate/tungstate import ATP-binding protein WtpC n=1 Tax=Natronococcus pandeyae TaxID=2055836 RepID=A0A8J8Q684_9EURY|nr:ATP-binding cassette domain-containing protein [Natronococcus pandeyae]TYL40141.1 ABC transporter [Natronococcus pandeyae]